MADGNFSFSSSPHPVCQQGRLNLRQMWFPRSFSVINRTGEFPIK
jgi:hypothetical protein